VQQQQNSSVIFENNSDKLIGRLTKQVFSAKNAWLRGSCKIKVQKQN